MANKADPIWREMETAPRDGTRILVETRSSEQGPAEVDMVRWARPERFKESCWLSADSDPATPVVYAEAELQAWMPIPAPAPRVRAAASSDGRRKDEDEIGGSGI